MKKFLSLLNERQSWIIAILFLGTWLCSELFLVRWGDKNLPISKTLNGYTSASNIVFMGNSRVAAGFKPSVISQASRKNLGCLLSSYNLGVGSAPFGIHYLLFKHLLKQSKQPKTIIYGFVDNDLTETIFFDDALLAQVAYIEDFPVIFTKSLLTIDNRVDFLIKKMSKVYRYRFLIREVLANFLTNSQINFSRRNSNTGGFQAFGNIVRKEAIGQLIRTEEIRYKQLYSNPENWAFEPKKAYLEDFLQLAIQAKVKVIFVEMPITRLHIQMAQKSFYRKKYFEQLRIYLENHSTQIIDMSDVESDNYLPDTMHLSEEGATLFTQKIFDNLIQPGATQKSIPDLRECLKSVTITKFSPK